MSIKSPIEKTFMAVNGIQLHVVQAGPVDGELVILLHGFPEFWYGWRHQIDPLVEAGFRVWVPDQRGYHLSDKPQGIDAYRLETLAADVVGLIAASGREKVYLAAHDWGAVVAWWVAIHHPELLKKLIILNVPHPAVMRKTLQGNPAQMLKSWYIGFFQIPWLPEQVMLGNGAALADMLFKRTANPGSFQPEDIAEYRRAWQIPGVVTGMLNWYRALAQRAPRAARSMRVKVPTLILWGVNDVALSREMAPASAQYCEDARLVWFEKATHWVQHDEPERVSQEMIAFFSA